MKKIKILQVTQEPVTIWAFLRELIHELENRGYEVETACNDKDINIIKQLKEEKIKVNIIDIRRSVNPVNVVKSFMQFYKLMKAKRYDIVIVHTPIVSFISRFAAFFAKVPVIIYTSHGLPFMKGLNPVRNAVFAMLEKFAGKVTSAMICVNNEDFDTAKKLRMVKSDKIFKINGIGVDTEYYKVRKIISSCEDSAFYDMLSSEEGAKHTAGEVKYVGFIGRLIKEKGIIEFLEAADAILKKRSDICFIIAGFGPLEGFVENFINDRKLQDKIRFMGFIKDTRSIYQKIDIFVLPTYYPEGLPRTILEAMSMEVPVVATDIRGCRQLVEDGVTGFLIPAKNAKKIEDAVLKLSDDKELRVKMGQLGRKKVEREYNIIKIIDEQIKIYEECYFSII